MKRGLKPVSVRLGIVTEAPGPNPGPDEEGIETLALTPGWIKRSCPNPGPDEEGIETLSSVFLLHKVMGPNPGPDEEGIETCS